MNINNRLAELEKQLIPKSKTGKCICKHQTVYWIATDATPEEVAELRPNNSPICPICGGERPVLIVDKVDLTP